MPGQDTKSVVCVSADMTGLAGDIAYHTAAYENAWRKSDEPAMQEHYQQLEALCDENATATLLRAACVITGALTRASLPDTGAGLSLDHLRAATQREALIREYLTGLQGLTGAELQGAAA